MSLKERQKKAERLVWSCSTSARVIGCPAILFLERRVYLPTARSSDEPFLDACPGYPGRSDPPARSAGAEPRWRGKAPDAFRWGQGIGVLRRGLRFDDTRTRGLNSSVAPLDASSAVHHSGGPLALGQRPSINAQNHARADRWHCFWCLSFLRRWAIRRPFPCRIAFRRRRQQQQT
jgi:hypothetical protein